MARQQGLRNVDELRALPEYDFNPAYTGGGRQGKGRWYRFDVTDDELAGVAPHICMGDDAFGIIKKMVENGSRGWGSNMYKQRVGIGMSGESPGKDTRTGGATRIFQGIFRKAKPKKAASGYRTTSDFADGQGRVYRESNYYNSDYATVRFRGQGLRDVDAIHFDHDNFGRIRDMESSHTFKRSYGRSSSEGLLRNISGGGNEMLPKEFVSLSELDLVMVRTEAQRKELIQILRDAGIKPTKPPNRRWESIITVLKE